MVRLSELPVVLGVEYGLRVERRHPEDACGAFCEVGVGQE